ncbi:MULTISPECIES: polyribonucleotide nucleotidyltransferase [unclassified Helicobacter]|uniref:polyribonucleotide nucleotidyltransferase n=1 Tax=unclassified Helicobacter TaxID=2593540 RepID=UPI000CF1750B|nr:MULTISPECIES: polyribonucleotide nucleotidyltransferase [unclassified Helicobacter]
MHNIDIALEGWSENLKIDYVAKQASGSVLYQHKGTVILASVAIDDEDIEGNFLPLSVQYIEKSYAVGKIPGGFIKREGKPSEFEVLTSRLIDRSLRPLFPNGYKRQTHISVFVLSYDRESDLQVCALNAAANALFISSVPFMIPVVGVRVGRIDGEFIFNPTIQQLQISDIDLFISGSFEDLLMIEMKGGSLKDRGVDEEELLDAINFAKEKINKMSFLYENSLKGYKKEEWIQLSEKSLFDQELYTFLEEKYHHQIQDILFSMAKSERATQLNNLAKLIFETNQENWDLDKIEFNIQEYKKNFVRNQILKQGVRVDGRKLNEVRPIDIQTNFLPQVHGSVLFTRGQTQALVVSTLGSENDAQSKELLSDHSVQKEFFTFHYNFPGFSVGEASMIGSVGRRELGHGNLARKALEDSIVHKDETVRLVSEILESNGSSSMASVCGGSLALVASGVETTGLIAGVAMGLIKEGEKYAILTDIMGLEDHEGDMDFKVAGNTQVITAMQMDIKIKGIDLEILKKALYQAKEARIHILSIMQEANSKIQLNQSLLPKTEKFEVPAAKIVDIIGTGGKTIKEIIEKFEVSVDLNRDSGGVKIFGNDAEKVLQAKEFILQLVGEKQGYVEGEIFEGVVKKIVDFGVFVSLPKGGDGLLHVSKIVQNKSQKPSDLFQEGQKIYCKILGFNKGKIDLDLKK